MFTYQNIVVLLPSLLLGASAAFSAFSVVSAALKIHLQCVDDRSRLMQAVDILTTFGTAIWAGVAVIVTTKNWLLSL